MKKALYKNQRAYALWIKLLWIFSKDVTSTIKGRKPMDWNKAIELNAKRPSHETVTAYNPRIEYYLRHPKNKTMKKDGKRRWKLKRIKKRNGKTLLQ